MIRIRGQEEYERYDLLIDEQTVIGWDNLLRGKFLKQWKIQQRAYTTTNKLPNPPLIRKDTKKKSAQVCEQEEEKQNRRLSRVLSGDYSYHTRNMDR
jgi:hypothetical protein